MTEQSAKFLGAGLSKRELVAVGCSAAIIIAGAIFWTIQIIGVAEMLKLAYG